MSDDQAYRAMDFLLDALDDIAGEVFHSVAHQSRPHGDERDGRSVQRRGC
jgi:hypothetical protein